MLTSFSPSLGFPLSLQKRAKCSGLLPTTIKSQAENCNSEELFLTQQLLQFVQISLWFPDISGIM